MLIVVLIIITYKIRNGTWMACETTDNFRRIRHHFDYV